MMLKTIKKISALALVALLPIHSALASPSDLPTDSGYVGYRSSQPPTSEFQASAVSAELPSCTCSYPPSSSFCSITCNAGERAICNVSPVLEDCRCSCQ